MYDCRGRGWFKRIPDDDGPLEQVPCKGCHSCGGPKEEEKKTPEFRGLEDEMLWDLTDPAPFRKNEIEGWVSQIQNQPPITKEDLRLWRKR